jgi:hypothetical protein
VGLVVAALGAAVLAGWDFRSGALLRLDPALPIMRPTTALCLVCLGVALVAVTSARRRPGPAAASLAVGAAGFAGLAAALSLVERFGGPHLSLEHLLFPAAFAQDPSGMRMAVATSVEVLLLSVAVTALATDLHLADALAQALGLAALTGSAVALLAFLYGEAAPYGRDVRSAMAVHAAAGLAVMSVGVLASIPGGLLPRLLTTPGAGSALLRRLLLGIGVVLPALGWLMLRGEKLGLYGTPLGLAMMTFAVGVLVCAVAWRLADLAEQAERSRAMLRDAWYRLGAATATQERPGRGARRGPRRDRATP